MNTNNIGSSLDDFLREEDLYDTVTAAAIKCAVASQIVLEMAGQNLSKSAMVPA